MPTRKTPNTASGDHVGAFRRFNRFHTRLVGALGDRVLGSDLSLPQVRVLYEVANAPPDRPSAANRLAQALGLDPGYLSRLIAAMEAADLLWREPSPDNAKRKVLGLTAKGRRVFARLDARSAAEVGKLLAGRTPAEQSELVGAMARIRRLLGDAPGIAPVILRDPVPGDFGWIVHKQGLLYAREYGWDQTFEALVAEIVGKFSRDFVPGRERCWVAEREGEVVGSVFVVRQDDITAKLRLLYVDPSARGHGLGRRLVDECLRFARAAGYARMVLWTNDVLVAARRIYVTAGFELVGEETHHSFGKDLVGQTWSREL